MLDLRGGSGQLGEPLRVDYERFALLGAITLEGVSALMTISAFTNRPVFAAFVGQVLVPTLRPGQVVALDHLPAHKYPEVEHGIQAAGCKLLFLRRYSPEFNPIEPCWSKLWNRLRNRAGRTLESLQEAVGKALQTITVQNARGWFTHCG